MSVLEIKNLKKIYASENYTLKALDNVGFNMGKGDFTAIMGPSGSGKTTLLNCISTFDSVSSGNIYVNGEDITEMKKSRLYSFRRNELGFIHQEYNLLDNITVFDNIAIALAIKEHLSRKETEEKVLEIAKILETDKILDKYPTEISGGERQRCAVARAVIKSPSVLLADEPTGALDYGNAKNFLKLLKKINAELETTILMVTHDSFAASFAERVLFLTDGKIFNELCRGRDPQKQYYAQINKIISVMGEGIDD